MPAAVTSSETLWSIYLANNRSAYATAKQLNLSHSGVAARVRRIAVEMEKEAAIEFPSLPDPDVPLEELIEARKRRYEKLITHEEASKLIPVRVKDKGVIGILFFGDPHLDNDGTDLGAFDHHTDLVVNTPGLYCANIGDVTDNWIGRLARLYAESSTTEHDAWRLAQHYITRVRNKLLFLIGGNHDLWSGGKDPLAWIMRQTPALYRASECRMEITTANGRKFRINARHDFKGNSMWNPAHGNARAIIMGVRDHITVSGHKHTSGHNEIKCPDTGANLHALQIASYKWIDRFARDHGFRDQKLSPCAVTLIDTNLDAAHPDFVKVYWDADKAVADLTALRK